MPSSYHERDTPGHVELWITGQGIELRATEVSHCRHLGLCFDNLSFSGKMKFTRKHTLFIVRYLPQLVNRSIGLPRAYGTIRTSASRQ